MECFVYQKHIDLHAVSALEAINTFMNLTDCKRLSRYVHWTIDVDTTETPSEFFSKITEKSYYLLNPNKEGFYTNLKPIGRKDVSTIVVDVFPKVELDNTVLVDKLNLQCGTHIKRIQKAVTWQCEIDYQQDSKAYVKTHLLPSETSSGILANPIYESFRFLSN